MRRGMCGGGGSGGRGERGRGSDYNCALCDAVLTCLVNDNNKVPFIAFSQFKWRQTPAHAVVEAGKKNRGRKRLNVCARGACDVKAL